MVVGLILEGTFGHLRTFRVAGYCPLVPGQGALCGGLKDWTSHLILPWITFALLFLALYTRMIRLTVAETMHEDFVRTARAKGAGETRVLAFHVLPNASLRVLTMIGMEIGTAIGVAIFIEAAFGIRGLGRLAVLAMGGGEPLARPSARPRSRHGDHRARDRREPDRRPALRPARPARCARNVHTRTKSVAGGVF